MFGQNPWLKRTGSGPGREATTDPAPRTGFLLGHQLAVVPDPAVPVDPRALGDEPEYRIELDKLLDRSIALIGPSGAGKTSLMTELLAAAFDATDGPALVLDYTDTLTDGLEKAVAKLWMNRVAGTASSDSFRRTDHARFLARHAFVRLGNQGQTVGIDFLRRCRIPEGDHERDETPAEVAGRIVSGFSAQFEDNTIRVRFQRILTAVITLLCAGDRRITEWKDLLDPWGPYHRDLGAQHLALGAMHDPAVEAAWVTIREHVGGVLLRSDGDKDVFSKRKDEYLDSTMNALEPFRTGPVADFFSRGSVKLEDLAYGGQRLIVSAPTLANLEQRDLTFRLLYGSFFSLLMRRLFHVKRPQGLLVIDEVAWLQTSVLRGFDRIRNHRYSIVISRQDRVGNFRVQGMDGAAELFESVLPAQLTFRPKSDDDAYRLAGAFQLFDPDGKWIEHEQVTRMASTSTSMGESVEQQFDAEGNPIIVDPRLSPLNRDGRAAKGSTTTEGTSTSTARTRIPVEEQRNRLAQLIQRLPDFHYFYERGPTCILLHWPRDRDPKVSDDERRRYQEAHDLNWEAATPKAEPPSPTKPDPIDPPAESRQPRQRTSRAEPPPPEPTPKPPVNSAPKAPEAPMVVPDDQPTAAGPAPEKRKRPRRFFHHR